MLRKDTGQERSIISDLDQLYQAATCNAVERELKRWTSPFVYPYPVELEPPFEAFDPSITHDRKHLPVKAFARKTSKAKKAILARLSFPVTDSVSWTAFENGIRRLSTSEGTVSLEITAHNGSIGVFLYGSESAVRNIVAGWNLVIPGIRMECVLFDPLASLTEADLQNMKIAEVHNPAPYPYLIVNARDFSVTPINAVFQAMTSIDIGDMAIYQFLITAVEANWMKSIWAIEKANAFLGKRAAFPSVAMGKSKLQANKPLFAAKLRLAYVGKSREQFERLLSLIGPFHAGGEGLSYRTIKELRQVVDDKKLLEMLIHRLAHTTGMLLDSAEAAAFMSLPDASVETVCQSDIGLLKGFPVPDLLTHDGLPLGRNTYGGVETVVRLQNTSQNPGKYVIGSNAGGKSTAMEGEMLWYIEQGASVILIDFHGETVDSLLQKIPDVAEDRVVVLDPSSDEFIPRLNLFVSDRESEIGPLAVDAVEGMRGMFPDSWGPRMNHILVYAVAGLFTLNKNLAAVLPLLSHTQEGRRLRNRVANQTSNPEVRRFFREEFDSYNKDVLASITNKISSLMMHERMRQMFSTQENAFDFERLMNGGVLVVKLSIGLLGVDVAAWIGNFILSHIQKLALRRAATSPDRRVPCHIYVDEVHRMKNLSVCHSIINEARKYRVYQTASHQETGQLSEADFKAFTSMSNIMVFRLNLDDARKMSKLFNGKVAPEEIMNLGVGEVFARIENQVVNFTTFPPRQGDPEKLSRIMQRCHKLYYRQADEISNHSARDNQRTNFELF